MRDDRPIHFQGLDTDLFEENSVERAQFQADLATLIDINDPIARAIVCLESPHSTPTDVLLFIAAAWLKIWDLFTDMKSTHRVHVPVDKILKILTKRFNELFKSPNHDAYFTALALHPGASIGV